MHDDTQLGFEGMELQEGSDSAEPPVAEPAALPDTVPALVRYWTAAWPHYVEVIRAAENAVSEMRAEEDDIDDEIGSAWVWDPLGRESIGSLGRSAIAAVTRCALKELCNNDSNVFSDYQAREIIEDCGCVDNPEKPDFLCYWNALYERFGNGAGLDKGKRLAAKRIRDSLNFYTDSKSRRCTPTLERGGVLFDIGYSWVEKSYSSNGYRISYNAQSLVHTLLQDLETVLGVGSVSWAHAWQFQSGGREIGIRLPLRLDVAGWRWTLLKERTRLWVPQEFALELRAALDDLSPETGESD